MQRNSFSFRLSGGLEKELEKLENTGLFKDKNEVINEGIRRMVIQYARYVRHRR